MNEILSKPEIQSAVAPFIVGLVIFIGLRKLTTTAWLWAALSAFLVSAILINGLTIIPLTGTRKIILLVLASFIVAGLIHLVIRRVNTQRIALYTLAILSLLWVFWKVLVRMQATEIALFLAGSVGLVLWLLWAFDRIGNSDAQLHGAGFSLMLGTGLSATVGASALLGQLALSLSAASGAVLLVWVLMGETAESGHDSRVVPSLPYALAAALLGLAGVIFARMPWYTLIPLALIPFVTGFMPKKTASRFTNALITSLPGLFIALAVSFWIWQTGSSGSGY